MSKMSQGKLLSPDNLLDHYQGSKTDLEGFELVLDVLSEDNWLMPREIYDEYRERSSDPVSKSYFSNLLKEVVLLGEAEFKGEGPNRMYRKSDRPVKEVVEYNRQSMAMKNFTGKIKGIAEKEVEKSLDSGKLEEMIERKAEEKLAQMINSSEGLDTQAIQVQVEEDLDYHKQRLLNTLKELEDWQSLTQLYSIYTEKVEDPVTRRSVRRYLNELGEKDLIDSKGRTKSKKYISEA